MLAGINSAGTLTGTGNNSEIPQSMLLSELPVMIGGNRPINGNPTLEAFPLELGKDDVIEAQREYGNLEAAVDYAKEVKALRAKSRAKMKELHGIVLDDKENEMDTALGMTQRQATHGRKVQKFAFNVEMEQAFNGGYLDSLTDSYSFLSN